MKCLWCTQTVGSSSSSSSSSPSSPFLLLILLCIYISSPVMSPSRGLAYVSKSFFLVTHDPSSGLSSFSESEGCMTRFAQTHLSSTHPSSLPSQATRPICQACPQLNAPRLNRLSFRAGKIPLFAGSQALIFLFPPLDCC